jgi:putative membrane protein
MPELIDAAFLKAAIAFARHFAILVGVVATFTAIYVKFTPYREFSLIRNGGPAATTAAVSLAGALVGFAIPLTIIAAHSGPVETVLWAVVSGSVQLACYSVIRRLLIPDVGTRIEAGEIHSAITLAGASILVGMLQAASLVP